MCGGGEVFARKVLPSWERVAADSPGPRRAHRLEGGGKAKTPRLSTRGFVQVRSSGVSTLFRSTCRARMPCGRAVRPGQRRWFLTFGSPGDVVTTTQPCGTFRSRLTLARAVRWSLALRVGMRGSPLHLQRCFGGFRIPAKGHGSLECLDPPHPQRGDPRATSVFSSGLPLVSRWPIATSKTF